MLQNPMMADTWATVFPIAYYTNLLVPTYISHLILILVMGKAEGRGTDWHGHVTALTVSPTYRRIGLANQLMEMLETVSEKIYNGYFVDLFVRASNSVAIAMYQKMGYSIYRRVLEYYSGNADSLAADEDAFDMRKALPRDTHRQSIIPLKKPVRAEDLVGEFQ